jgi:hypothetical protein
MQYASSPAGRSLCASSSPSARPADPWQAHGARGGRRHGQALRCRRSRRTALPDWNDVPRHARPPPVLELHAEHPCDNLHLSGLDNVAKTLFTRIRDIAAEYNRQKLDGAKLVLPKWARSGTQGALRCFVLLNGHAVERWALKVLCGAAFSDNTSHEGMPLRNWVVPDTWLSVLVGARPLEPPRGLYHAGGGDIVSSAPGFAFGSPLQMYRLDHCWAALRSRAEVRQRAPID